VATSVVSALPITDKRPIATNIRNVDDSCFQSRGMKFESYLRRAAAYILDIKDGTKGIKHAKQDFADLYAKSALEAHDYSLMKLKRMLVHAYETTTYYRTAFDKAGFRPAEISGGDDLCIVPMLTRQAIQENSQELISRKFSKTSLIQSFTGGTNGTPVTFYRDRSCHVQRLGRRLKILELCGYHRGDRCAWIWGVHADLDAKPRKAWHDLKGRFRRFAVAKEMLCCTTLTPEAMETFHGRLVQFKPKVLYGYPNAMAHFAEFVESCRLQPIEVQTIISTAERLTETQRRRLSEVFGGTVYNMYATREHGFVGFECNGHCGFHIDSGNVFLEILNDGKPTIAGQAGEIVVTDLNNFGMPFIRYRIGDVGRVATKPCQCGCPLPLLQSFDGRTTDAVFRPDGTRVDGVMLVDLFSDNKSILAMQIVQQRMAGINLNLVVAPGYDKSLERQIVQEVRKYMGDESEIAIHLLPDIPRNPRSGKFQQVICQIGASNGSERL
jgi:phenylacetate-CoA ligase